MSLHLLNLNPFKRFKNRSILIFISFSFLLFTFTGFSQVNSSDSDEIISFDSNSYNFLGYSEPARTEVLPSNPITAANDVSPISIIKELPTFNMSNQQWGDFDNDKDLDFVISGIYGSGWETKLFINKGNNQFDEAYGCGIAAYRDPSISIADYDRDGYADILISGNLWDLGNSTKIYHNNKNLTFTEVSGLNFLSLIEGSSSWADFDNDGDLDLIVNGLIYSLGEFTKIYKNNGNNSFSEAPALLPGLKGGGITCGDFDNDGLTDLLMVGTNLSALYHNEGDFIFTEIAGTDFPLYQTGKAAWGDEDNDGFLDIFISGQVLIGYETKPKTQIYHNNQNGTFSKTQMVFESDTTISAATIVWSDLNADGLIDLAYAGGSGNQPSGDGYNTDPGGNHFYVYFNNGDHTYTKISTTGILALGNCALTAADYDNNGTTGLLYSGRVGNPCFSDGHCELHARTYLLNIEPSKVKAKPAKLEGIKSENFITKVTFSWNPAMSEGQVDNSVSYNLRIGKTLNGIDIMSDISDNSGYYRNAQFGNCFKNTSITINKLAPGKYYWGVQAISNSFIGGEFATDSITIEESQAYNLSASTMPEIGYIKVKWENGNGMQRILFCKKGNSDNASPLAGTAYFADSKYENGDQIGNTGWYCVYNGRADSAIVYGLMPGDVYTFEVMEYSGTNGSQVYNLDFSGTNLGVFSAGSFSSINQTGIAADDNVQWIDFDGNGFLDIASAWAITFNDGNGSFQIKQRTALDPPDGVNGTLGTYADYNNDGLFDFYDGYKTYLNNGDRTFYVKDTLNTDYSSEKMIVSDLNNDGNVDFVYSKQVPFYLTDNSYITDSTNVYVYYGNGDGTFTNSKLLSSNKGEFNLTIDDFSNDAIPDLFLSGSAYVQVSVPDSLIFEAAYGIKYYINEDSIPTRIIIFNDGNKYTDANLTRILINDKSNNYTEVFEYDFSVNYWDGSLSVVDYNNDGNPDLVMSYNEQTSIYKNLGKCVFQKEEASGIISGILNSQSWGDIDNDGYMDLVTTGRDSYDRNFTKVYINNKNNTFSEIKNVPFSSIEYYLKGDAILGDYDNDGDLDFLLTDNNFGIQKIYRNNYEMKAGLSLPNTRAGAPIINPVVMMEDGIRFSWNAPIEKDETFPNGLTYNLRYKNIESENWLGSAMSDDEGNRKVFSMGNMEFNKSFTTRLLSGTYVWQVQAIDGGFLGGAWSDVDTFTIKKTQSFFTANTVCLGKSTQFTNQSVVADGIKSLKWYFGDNSTSTIENPTHTYTEGKTYLVSLVITDTKDVKDSISIPVIVKTNPRASFVANSACFGTETSFSNTTVMNGARASSWSWNYGNGDTSNDSIPLTKTYTSIKTYKASLTVTSPNGCSSDSTIDIVISPLPNANISISSDSKLSFCKNAGDKASLSIPVQANCSYKWLNHNIPIAGKTQNSLEITDDGGSFTAMVTNDLGNCSSISTSPVEIVVKESPVAPVIAEANNNTNFCAGSEVELIITSEISDVEYQWKRSGMDILGANQTSFKGKLAAGDYTVEALAGSCSATSQVLTLTAKSALPKPQIIARGPNIWILGCDNLTSKDYKWYYNDVLIVGAKTHQYVANQKLGNYRVEVTDGGECYTSSDVINIPTGNIVSGVEDLDAGTIEIFPNPTEYILNVNFGNYLDGKLEVEILNGVGSVLSHKEYSNTTGFTMDISGFAKGVYYCRITYKQNSVIRKVVKL